MAQVHSSGDSDLHLVFVYGSLKRGMANHQQLAGAPCLGSAQLQGLRLYDLGPFPMAVESPDDAQANLQGELYAVGSSQLANLDRFEGVPRLYRRQRHQLADGRAVWIYVGRPQQVRHVPAIPDGDWRGPRP